MSAQPSKKPRHVSRVPMSMQLARAETMLSMLKGGKTMAEIAAHYEVGESYVHTLTRCAEIRKQITEAIEMEPSAGITPPAQYVYAGTREDRDAAMTALIAFGWNTSDLCAQFEVTRDIVRKLRGQLKGAAGQHQARPAKPRKPRTNGTHYPTPQEPLALPPQTIQTLDEIRRDLRDETARGCGATIGSALARIMLALPAENWQMLSEELAARFTAEVRHGASDNLPLAASLIVSALGREVYRPT